MKNNQLLYKYNEWLNENVLLRCNDFIEEYIKTHDDMYDNFENIYDDENDDYKPIYEYYLVTDDGYKKFKELGEPVCKINELSILGRTCTGQQMYLDYMYDTAKLNIIFKWL